MQTQIEIGKQVSDDKHLNGKAVVFDIVRLIKTRLLICANSGGGKSWLLRALAELLCKIMPVIIFDWEGEFSTLREKFDFLIIGKNGDAPADCRSAKLVMLRLLEWRSSAVIDLSELPPDQKHLYVKLACEAAIASPKELWRETAFMFDEAHEVCPENGKGFSIAKQAVLGFPTKGRKRRFLSIFSTQRVHKLALDARAEMLNRMIGMTFEPDDLEVAAKIAGVYGKEEIGKFRTTMRTMGDGNFFTFGRAVSLETILVKVRAVQTTHEQYEAGFATPPASKRIKKLLPQLADLPREADEQEQTMSELRQRIKNLTTELGQVKSAQNKSSAPAPQVKPAQIVKQTLKIPALISEAALDRFTKQLGRMEKLNQNLENHGKLTGTLLALGNGISEKIIDGQKAIMSLANSKPQAATVKNLSVTPPAPLKVAAKPHSTLPAHDLPTGDHLDTDFRPTKCQKAILNVLRQFPAGCGISKLAMLSLYKVTGSFRTELSGLRAAQAITGDNNDMMRITSIGMNFATSYPIPEDRDGRFNFFLNHPAMTKCQRAIMNALNAHTGDGLLIDELTAQCDPPYQVTGSFRTELSGLRTADIITGSNKQRMKLNPELFN